MHVGANSLPREDAAGTAVGAAVEQDPRSRMRGSFAAAARYGKESPRKDGGEGKPQILIMGGGSWPR